MTEPRPLLLCQRCHHNLATHSFLGKFLLCLPCSRIIFSTQAPLPLEGQPKGA